jgi:crotonobetainyl-CoA:carnitine CoA-transferase CaiB-like acyl-CoA transferase
VVNRSPAGSSLLTGITVLEFDNGLSEFAGKILADSGARVIRVEPPAGAPSRSVGPYVDDIPGLNSSLQFAFYNTSKESLIADMSQPTDIAMLKSLTLSADVVLDGMGAGKLEAAGLGYEQLRALNPGLVYCAVTPFGTSGPWSGFEHSDLTQLALGGVMEACGYDDPEQPPVAPPGGQARHVAGMMAAIAIMAALFQRNATGEGQRVEISAHEAIAVSTEMAVPFWLYQGREVRRHTARHAMPHATPRWQHACADGKQFLALPLYLDDSRFKAMLEWFDSEGMAEDLKDDRYGTAAGREREMLHVVDVIGRFCARHDSDYMFRESQARGLPWAPVNAPDELRSDPHFSDARKAFAEIAAHDCWGGTRDYPQLPFLIGLNSATPATPPTFGEHSEEIRGRHEPAPEIDDRAGRHPAQGSHDQEVHQ